MLNVTLRIEYLGDLRWTTFPWNILDRSWLFEFFGHWREIFYLRDLLFLWFFVNLLCALWCLNLVFGSLQRLNWGRLPLIKNKRRISLLSGVLCCDIVLVAEWESKATIHRAIWYCWRHYINSIDWSSEIIIWNSACCPIWVERLNNMLRVLLSQSC